jgi:hypothetical protein
VPIYRTTLKLPQAREEKAAPAACASGEEQLPALRGLKDLADRRPPVLVIDSREEVPLVFKRFLSVTGTLNAGDYSIRGLESSFAVERELHRLKRVTPKIRSGDLV